MQRKKAFLRLFVAIFLITSAGLTTSCNDGNETVPPQTGEQNGGGNYTISGDRNREFSAEVMFQDTSDYSSSSMSLKMQEVDQVLIVESYAKAENDSSRITAYIARNETNDRIGTGTYEAKLIDSTIESGMTIEAWLQGSPFRTRSNTEMEGTIKINSREDNTLEGEFQDVKLQGTSSLMYDTTLMLNGSFTARSQ